MPTLQFKTNINCGGCVRAVTPLLNEEKEITRWQVDTDNPAKILTVEGEQVQPEQVIRAVQEAGFEIEPA
ncbi:MULTISPECIES: heavy-metal-associated domain-containing protein [Hymenobacter]|uniref:Heavy-metal-associated domain-containing protein n=1 Tax=Hymenobacter jejuensis TaxID=2502781 RepID=A0A5B8A0C3_9BACT|nr:MULTISPECIES: heavy-metal-associated domain-containing protein [Hymenobacter]MBC6991097.1 heavy-metal-associated domain-containing protein [Hymenobacter sp. BT491]QDA60519.1 heavy-metal-associated domain-containing protein [Hymenobacter jejuensis]